MNNHRLTLFVIAAAVTFGYLLTGCREIGHPGPPASYSPSQVMDNWIALSDRNDTYYLLTLKPDSSGTLALQTAAGTFSWLKVVAWNLNGYKLSVRFDPTQSENRVSQLVCFVQGDMLLSTLHGATGWTEDMIFRRASVLDQRLTLLKNQTKQN
jgi:hypothetical protein